MGVQRRQAAGAAVASDGVFPMGPDGVRPSPPRAENSAEIPFFAGREPVHVAQGRAVRGPSAACAEHFRQSGPNGLNLSWRRRASMA